MYKVTLKHQIPRKSQFHKPLQHLWQTHCKGWRHCVVLIPSTQKYSFQRVCQHGSAKYYGNNLIMSRIRHALTHPIMVYTGRHTIRIGHNRLASYPGFPRTFGRVFANSGKPGNEANNRYGTLHIKCCEMSTKHTQEVSVTTVKTADLLLSLWFGRPPTHTLQSPYCPESLRVSSELHRSLHSAYCVIMVWAGSVCVSMATWGYLVEPVVVVPVPPVTFDAQNCTQTSQHNTGNKSKEWDVDCSKCSTG